MCRHGYSGGARITELIAMKVEELWGLAPTLKLRRRRAILILILTLMLILINQPNHQIPQRRNPLPLGTGATLFDDKLASSSQLFRFAIQD